MKGSQAAGAMAVTCALLLSLLVVEGISSDGTTEPGPHTVLIGKNETAGRFLTDAHGMTLYYFRKDTQGNSVCIADCLAKWPPFHIETISAPAGVDAEEFSFITRREGKRQTTYRGFPLYYFSGDKKPGDTLGHGTDDLWFAAAPDKFRR